MIEEVKKILTRVYVAGLHREPLDQHADEVAQQICQLKEEDADIIGRLKSRGWISPEEAKEYVRIKSDEGRLLTDEEIKTAIKIPTNLPLSFEAVGIDFERIAKAQDAKTASIKDAECQERVERIFNLAEEYCPHNHKDGIQNRPQHYCEDCWQALKKKELK